MHLDLLEEIVTLPGKPVIRGRGLFGFVILFPGPYAQLGTGRSSGCVFHGLTEIGFALPEEEGVHIPVHGDEVYGQALVDYAEKKGISWVVWCFDPDWSPYMFTDWDYTPTRQGTFFKKVMSGN